MEAQHGAKFHGIWVHKNDCVGHVTDNVAKHKSAKHPRLKVDSEEGAGINIIKVW